MSLSIKIETEETDAPCEMCGATAVVMLVTANGGTDYIGPLCLEHLAAPQTAVIAAPKYAPPKAGKIRHHSQKQERQIMTDLGGRTQPASGSKPGAKGDGRLYGKLRMEAKFTFAGSYSLKLRELQKIRSECDVTEEPVLVLDFKDRATGRELDRWALLPYPTLLELLRKAGTIE